MNALEVFIPKEEILMRTFSYHFESLRLRANWIFLNEAEFMSLATHLAGYFSIDGFWPKAESKDIFKIVCHYFLRQ